MDNLLRLFLLLPAFLLITPAVRAGTVSPVAETSVVKIISQSVVPSRRGKGFDSLPHERTRPIVVGDIVYFANLLGDVYAIHRTASYTLWHRKLPAGVEGAFTYGRSKIFVGDSQGNLFALNARDGSIAWQFKVQSEWLSPPVLHRDKVFITTSSDDLYALSETHGKEIWHYGRRGDEKMTVRGTGSPAVFAGEVYQGFSDGYLVSLDITNGKLTWAKKLRTKERFYDVDMTPYVDEQGVIAATFDGNLYNLDRLTGNTNWLFKQGSYGGFLVEGNRLYFSGLDNTFYALDKARGEVVWKTEFEKGIGFTPTRVGDFIVATTSNDPVYVLNPDSGNVVWKGSLGTGTFAPAASHPDGFFYCMSNYGNLFSFEILKRFNGGKRPKRITVPSAFERDVAASPAKIIPAS